MHSGLRTEQDGRNEANRSLMEARRRVALYLLHAGNERLYSRLPGFMQRWVFKTTRCINGS